MDIVRSVELESCKLTKLTEPFIPVNLVGPLYWVPASRGSINFLCVIRRHFRWVRADSRGNVFFHEIQWPSGGSQQLGANVFFAIYWWVSGGSLLSGGGIIIFRVIRRHFIAAAVDPAVSLSTYNILPMEFGH